MGVLEHTSGVPRTHLRFVSCQHTALKASHFTAFAYERILSGKADVNGEDNFELVFWGQLSFIDCLLYDRYHVLNN